MPSNKRKRMIRALMAETGLKYMQAARQVDEEWARTQGQPPDDRAEIVAFVPVADDGDDKTW